MHPNNFRHSISIKFHEFHKLLIQLSVIESLLGQFRQALQAVAERLKQEWLYGQFAGAKNSACHGEVAFSGGLTVF